MLSIYQCVQTLWFAFFSPTGSFLKLNSVFFFLFVYFFCCFCSSRSRGCDISTRAAGPTRPRHRCASRVHLSQCPHRAAAGISAWHSQLLCSGPVWSGEAAAAEGARGDPGGQAEEDPSHERTSGLQQADQRKPVWVLRAVAPPVALGTWSCFHELRFYDDMDAVLLKFRLSTVALYRCFQWMVWSTWYNTIIRIMFAFVYLFTVFTVKNGCFFSVWLLATIVCLLLCHNAPFSIQWAFTSTSIYSKNHLTTALKPFSNVLVFHNVGVSMTTFYCNVQVLHNSWCNGNAAIET